MTVTPSSGASWRPSTRCRPGPDLSPPGSPAPATIRASASRWPSGSPRSSTPTRCTGRTGSSPGTRAAGPTTGRRRCGGASPPPARRTGRGCSRAACSGWRPTPPAGLPPRLSLFAPPALSPGDLDLLAALGRHIDVTLYLLDPCEEYWGDVIPERVRARRAAAGRLLGHAESGNPLLASLGRQSRDLLDALWDRDPVVEAHFRTPQGPTLLARIQRNILRLVPPQAEGRFTPPADDVSLQLHVCHSPMREVEVLHERLLDLFGRLPRLAATDVAVLVPDIREYAPLVEAVFGAAGRIPYTVADRPAADASPLAAGFPGLLAAAESRFEVDRIVDLLEIEAIQRRLGLGADDLTRIRHWLGEAGVRWGRDAAHRAAEGLPAEDAHTWARGLRRLLLGHALPGHGERLYEGVVPCGHVEGQAAEALGVLCDFVEALDELRRTLAEPRPMAAWRDLLLETLERFFLADEDEAGERAAVAEAVEGLAADAETAGHRAPVDAELVRAALESRLARPRGGSPRLAQGVVVAPITPLRGLPFRVVCLLGLDDGVFPRPAHDDRLDRTRTERRRADPDPRDEDRGIFLDALVSAREVLHLSYVGRDPRDDAPRPPSVLVGELMDYVRALHGGDPEGVRRITVHHRLQPFHPGYFRPGGPLHAHDAALCEGARRLAAGEPDDTPPEQRLFPQPLPEPVPPPVLAPESFARFFRRPVAFLLRERLGLRPETRDETLEAGLREAGRIPTHQRWYPGRPVMVVRNDYALRLFNGDVGVAVAVDRGPLRVWFPAPDGGPPRAFAPARLPPHETVFALTVHKSQGSKFEDVLLVLPDAPSRVLTRELLYTGITRARRHAEIWGGEAVVAAAVATPTRRSSGLRDALWPTACR